MKRKRIRWLGGLLASAIAVTSLPVSALAAEPVEVAPAETIISNADISMGGISDSYITPVEVVEESAEATSVEAVPEAVLVPESAIGTEEIPEAISVEEAEELISTDASYSGLSVKNVNAKPVVIGADALAQGNLVYLGTKSENYTWTDERPTWIVLDPKKANNGTSGYAFLLSQELIGEKDGGTWGKVYFDKDGKVNSGQTNPNEWQGSDAQAWCRTFLTGVFSSGEQAAILETNKTDEVFTNKVLKDDGTLYTSFDYGTSSLVNDQIFFLSAEEALTPAYGFPDKNKDSGNPALVANYKDKSSAGYWWLRSPYADGTIYAGLVIDVGVVFHNYVSEGRAARPAFNFNLKSVILSSAAAGGKSSGPTGAASLKKLNKQNIPGWKFTLADAARNSFAVTRKSYDGKTLVFSYSGAKTGSNEYISAIITDNTGKDIKYYGNVVKVSAASGEASIELTGKIAGGDKVFVFNEQLNGDYKTDYSSGLKELKLTAASSGSWKKTSDGKWWYKRADGTWPANKWERIDGKWYHFDAKGYMQTGWLKDGGKWYYLKSSGEMATGWVKVSGKWYYMNSSGAMQTGWQKISGKWYYFESSGAMLANTSKKIGKKTYTFDKNGVCTNP